MTFLTSLFFLFILAVATTILGTYAYLNFWAKNRILAEVNHRSAHTKAMPVGGGLFIALVASIACLLIELTIGFERNFALAFIPSSLLIVGIGFWDDMKGLNAKTRLGLYALAAGWALYLLEPVTEFIIPWHILNLGCLSVPLSFVFILWMTNLFNFMDGINGLVAGMTSLVAISFYFFGASVNLETSLFMLFLGAGCLGFLPWNFPNAKIFMGDVGSVYIGFSFALILMYNTENTNFVVSHLILLIPFIVDATMTLFMRLFKGENILQSHNKHLYQQLTLLWGGHFKTTGLYIFITALLLIPVSISSNQNSFPTAIFLCSGYFAACLLWVVTYIWVERRLNDLNCTKVQNPPHTT